MLDKRETIRRALRERFGSNVKAMAEAAGVRRATLHGIVKEEGHTSHITDRIWEVLAPQCQGCEVQLVPANAPRQGRSHHASVRPTRASDLGVAVPMIGFAHAADYEASLQSVEDFAVDASDGATVAFPQSRHGDLALTVEGDSMLPWYPPGTILLARPGEFPQRGDIVVARLNDGAVVVKRYQRRNSVVILEALNHGSEGETFEWHTKTQPGRVLWMWPVIASVRDERAIRWQATKMGAV